MTDFSAILGILYACNLMAEQAPLSKAQTLQCYDAHNAVKSHFLSEAELEAMATQSPGNRYRTYLRGYQRYKAWESNNADTVSRIRNEAAKRLAPGS